MPFFRIKNWQDLYENNRTREWKTVKWIPFPVKLNGDGYCTIMEDEKGNRRKDGPAIFGTFIAIVELAASCNPRGDLLKSDGTAHTFDSIGRICRISPTQIQTSISFCTEILNWIEIINLDIDCGNSDSGCGLGAAPNTISCNVFPCNSLKGFDKAKHGKRSKINPLHDFCDSPFYDFEEFKKALSDWTEQTQKDYYENAKNYSEAKGVKYANWIAAVKNWKRKDDKQNPAKPPKKPKDQRYHDQFRLDEAKRDEYRKRDQEIPEDLLYPEWEKEYK